jgi:membrane protease subunit (stomatin/prohibitin family)
MWFPNAFLVAIRSRAGQNKATNLTPPEGRTVGLLDKLRGEFIDIIEWTEPSQNDILSYRFPRYHNEIKYGAQLTVREGQAGAFVNEGQLADVYQPGRYKLETQNMPILATLKGWKYGFNSPFKAEVYFISTRQWTDQKWGTQNPVMVRDPEFGPVRLRAFGTYAFKVSDPATFLKQLVSTDPSFETYEVTNQLRNTIVSRIIDELGQSKLPMLELAGNYEKISKLALERIAPDLQGMGISLTLFYIENISLPPEVEAALDTRARMSVIGNVGEYTKFQTADAIRDAAQNPGGIAGVGAGVGAGFAIGGQMAGAMASAAQAPPVPSGPPPIPTAGASFFAAINGAQAGPFDMSALAAKVAAGQLTRASLVWKQGMSGWVAADTVPELHPLFANVPPPLPG